MTSEALSPAVVALLAEAAEWRLYGLLFEYPDAAWTSNVEALMASLADPDLRDLAANALRDASEGLHIALFGPAGTVPPREVTYRGGVQFGYLIAELAAFYDAFGYTPQAQEAPDHLAIELGFVSYLKLKHAHALANGEDAQAEVTGAACEEFVREHIAWQAEPVLKRLEDFAPDYLVEAGKRILAHAGPAPKSDFPLSPFEDDERMTCGPSTGAAADAGGPEELIQLEP